MENLIGAIDSALERNRVLAQGKTVDEVKDTSLLPFSVYRSKHEQQILNVPIVKPTLIVILKGEKLIGNKRDVHCKAGDFIFLSGRSSTHMRNVPIDEGYLALIVEFDKKDYEGIYRKSPKEMSYYLNSVDEALGYSLQQFIESSAWGTEKIWSLRKREILALLSDLGHQAILSLFSSASISQQLLELLNEKSHQADGFNELSIDSICQQLAMSESTLRRRLKAEGTSIQEIKDTAKLGLGLFLLQTSQQSISLIADQCGYQSQSRFSERFKNRFGLTPSDLRKTMLDE